MAKWGEGAYPPLSLWLQNSPFFGYIFPHKFVGEPLFRKLSGWHDFFIPLNKLLRMRDLILSIFLIAGAYIGSIVFAIALFRIFFPLKAKVVKEDKLLATYTRRKTTHASTNHNVQLLSAGGRRGWVKASS